MSKQKTLFDAPNQIRLAELSVYNWGSFHGLHSANIDRGGTLITGDNGTGKSTFIDGLMALLQPVGKATFNVAAAQGDRSDRSLLSYMRGSFGSAHDGAGVKIRSKREKGVVTGLRALYRADDGAEITLLALFWTLQTGNSLSDVKRLYLVAKQNVSLKTVLDQFHDGNVRTLKQWLKGQPKITCCDDRYQDYYELYRKLLSMENRNAPALLSRALGLKKIDDLTKLIRELVLEPSSIRDEAKIVVSEFADLVAIHQQLLDAKEQLSHLRELPNIANQITKLAQELASLSDEKQGLPVYFAEQQALQLQAKIAKIQQELTALQLQLSQFERQEQDLTYLVEQRHADYLNLGGERVEQLRREVAETQNRLQQVSLAASEYQQICQQLALDPTLNEPQFSAHQQQASARLNGLEQALEQALTQHAADLGQRDRLLSQLKQTESELNELAARPNSNIDVAYQKLRDELAASLGFGEQELMFIGELLEVKDQEIQWQGAIERALGGKRITLLVSDQRYRQVTEWLNRRHTGLFVRLQAVNLSEDFANINFKAQGFLNKLEWRDHPYQQWLKTHLAPFDLLCVNSVEALNATPYSLTQEGLIQLKSGYFEKKDQFKINDRRQWQLGFNNQNKLRLLEAEKAQLADELIAVLKGVEQSKQAHADLTKTQRQWERLAEVQWDQIDVPRHQQQLDKVRHALQALENAQGDLQQAKQRWEAAKADLKTVQQAKMTCNTQLATTEREQENCKRQLAQTETLRQHPLDEAIHRLLAKRIGEVRLDNPYQQREEEQRLDEQLTKVRQRKSGEENRAVATMNLFKGKEKWQPLTADWGVGLDGLADYLAHFSTLEKEGLPTLFEQFKTRLNKHTTQSLARLHNQFEGEFERIRERIAKINQVLQRTAFKANSYLRLGYKREKYPHVTEFDQKVKQALNFINHADHEKRFLLLQEVVNILDKASGVSANTLESQRLLDPRFQLGFFAEEIERESQAVLDVLDSSSGKSGGEKESFAGTIVAASLAYVLTPEDAERPVYCTVFLDEAFSNTAESVSRRVLAVFKALHIHVNLITPFKNLNLARESARSLLIAERDAERHESRLCEVTWEELDRQQAARKAQYSANLSDLGVEIEQA